MNNSVVSVLQRTAVSSGLLSRPQLDDVLSDLLVLPDGSPRTMTDVSDQELGEKLVEREYLNRWQVDQLIQGHTKFRLGPYRIVDAIGKGGMGHVFKGEHELLGRIEAIKVLPKSRSTPESIQCFQREIRVQAQLDHPNLVRISYADHDGDTFFLVTEYVPGADLRRLVRRHGPLSASIAASIISQAASGLHYAHGKGLVHRDVKPGNLLVTPEGLTKVTDLGLAWYLLDEVGSISSGRPKAIVGTSDYLAPETIAHPEQVRPVSDIYSLGCTLYYAVTGKVPFPGGNTSDKMRRHLNETPLNPLHFSPDLPEAFADVIARMMQRDPDRRVPTAERVIELVKPWSTDDFSGEVSSLAESSSGSLRADRNVGQKISASLAETATFDLDGLSELSPARSDSQSQISQPTEPIASSSEDTVEHGDPVPSDPVPEIKVRENPRRTRFPWGPIVIAIFLAVGLLAVLLAGV
ncbi:MAG: serine/threonine protein kinase [Pirellulales bacterium]|nr:serine/threonine protein kinase [Pirellulales bacterium]